GQAERVAAGGQPAGQLEGPDLGAAEHGQERGNQKPDLQGAASANRSRCCRTHASIACTTSAGEVLGCQPSAWRARLTSEMYTRWSEARQSAKRTAGRRPVSCSSKSSNSSSESVKWGPPPMLHT